MRLELDTMSDGTKLRSRLKAALTQIKEEREMTLSMLEREILNTASVLKHAADEVERIGNGGNHTWGSFGMVQGNCAKLDALSGRLEALDSVIELVQEVLRKPA